MTDKLSDTTPLIGISDDTESQADAGRSEKDGKKESFGSVLLNTATGQKEGDEQNPNADDGTADSSQA